MNESIAMLKEWIFRDELTPARFKYKTRTDKSAFSNNSKCVKYFCELMGTLPLGQKQDPTSSYLLETYLVG